MTRELIIEVPDESVLGPAMLKLTPMQRKFVIAMVEVGGNNTRCYLAAGYKDNPDNPTQARVNAHYLAHDPLVQEAIREVGMKMMNAGSLVAVKFVLDTINAQGAEMKDRIKCAEMIMNRTGLHAMTEHKVAVTHKSETTNETVKRIELMAERLGLDATKLLGNAIVEAVFEEVPKVEEDPNDISDIMGTDDEV